jgi:excisionase family DNA binding protein
MPEKLLTVDETATRLEVPVRTARWYAANGYLPGAQKVGRDWVIPEAAVAGFKPPDRGRPQNRES